MRNFINNYNSKDRRNNKSCLSCKHFLTLIKEFFNFFIKAKRENKPPNNYLPFLTILIAKVTARTAPITANAIATPE
jgi:hypothetical protein